MLHGVGEHAHGFVGCYIGLKAVDGAEEEEVAAIVAHREVPPEVGGALDERIHELECLMGEVGAHHIAGVEHIDTLVEGLAVNVVGTPGLGLAQRREYSVGHTERGATSGFLATKSRLRSLRSSVCLRGWCLPLDIVEKH